MSIHFAQITDVHVKEPGTEVRLAEALTRIEALRPTPDWVVFTGDMVEYGTEAEFAVLMPVLEAMRVQRYCLPGNHDSGNRSDFSLYERHLGALCQSFDSGGYHCVLLNTCNSSDDPDDWHGLVEAPALAWLGDDLRGVPAEQPVVLFHHHGLVGPEEDLSCDTANAQDVLDLLAGHNLVAAFGGHAHALRRFTWGDAELFLVPNLSMTRPNHANQPTGFLEVFIGNRDVNARYHIVEA